jgi:hypothetical protein
MSVHFDPWRRIYDLYSFDAPYDLEPTAFPESLQNYEETIDSHKNFTSADIEDEFRHLELTFEEAEPGRHFPTSGSRPFLPERDSSGSEHLNPSPVLGATLSQRKKLLKERIEELITDIRKREKLEEETLEKTEVEGAGLEFLLGQVRTWSLGNYPSVDMRRTNLEREILALKKAGRDERLRCWRDLVMLKKELREALEEYHLILSAGGL